jgi:hypothetical protein
MDVRGRRHDEAIMGGTHGASVEERLEDLLARTQVPRMRAMPGLREGRAFRPAVKAA